MTDLDSRLIILPDAIANGIVSLVAGKIYARFGVKYLESVSDVRPPSSAGTRTGRSTGSKGRFDTVTDQYILHTEKEAVKGT